MLVVSVSVSGSFSFRTSSLGRAPPNGSIERLCFGAATGSTSNRSSADLDGALDSSCLFCASRSFLRSSYAARAAFASIGLASPNGLGLALLVVVSEGVVDVDVTSTFDFGCRTIFLRSPTGAGGSTIFLVLCYSLMMNYTLTV